MKRWGRFYAPLVVVFLLCTAGFADPILSVPVAFEFQENGKHTGVIGKALITESSIETITFAKDETLSSVRIVPFAFIYSLLEKKEIATDLFLVKCQNQIGTVMEGTIDIRDYSHPKISLKAINGVTITNIGPDGERMKRKYIPDVDLGR